jgi:hypothetical protein
VEGKESRGGEGRGRRERRDQRSEGNEGKRHMSTGPYGHGASGQRAAQGDNDVGQLAPSTVIIQGDISSAPS